jgi:hypothetical protein
MEPVDFDKLLAHIMDTGGNFNIDYNRGTKMFDVTLCGCMNIGYYGDPALGVHRTECVIVHGRSADLGKAIDRALCRWQDQVSEAMEAYDGA